MRDTWWWPPLSGFPPCSRVGRKCPKSKRGRATRPCSVIVCAAPARTISVLRTVYKHFWGKKVEMFRQLFPLFFFNIQIIFLLPHGHHRVFVTRVLLDSCKRSNFTSAFGSTICISMSFIFLKKWLPMNFILRRLQIERRVIRVMDFTLRIDKLAVSFEEGEATPALAQWNKWPWHTRMCEKVADACFYLWFCNARESTCAFSASHVGFSWFINLTDQWRGRGSFCRSSGGPEVSVTSSPAGPAERLAAQRAPLPPDPLDSCFCNGFSFGSRHDFNLTGQKAFFKATVSSTRQPSAARAGKEKAKQAGDETSGTGL